MDLCDICNRVSGLGVTSGKRRQWKVVRLRHGCKCKNRATPGVVLAQIVAVPVPVPVAPTYIVCRRGPEMSGTAG